MAQDFSHSLNETFAIGDSPKLEGLLQSVEEKYVWGSFPTDTFPSVGVDHETDKQTESKLSHPKVRNWKRWKRSYARPKPD